MIYTLTANPSIDYVLQLQQLNLGAVNRTSADFKLPGGKGINVSRILQQLNMNSIAWGFVGGATGKLFESLLAQNELSTD
ncbi:1-phosphofructokinase, partial [Lactobacillus sp. XV13L]|nr:1-phosphofructokinase [Lactobacillus sp. XV13L]